MISIALNLLISLSAPLLLLPVEKLLPYPYVIEEAVKFFVASNLNKNNPTKKITYFWAALCGLLFTLSESIFYLVNIFALGDIKLFFYRFAFTGILHTTTILLMLFLLRKGKFAAAAGIVFSVVIHYFYNSTLQALILAR
jgi:hypothetical protein